MPQNAPECPIYSQRIHPRISTHIHTPPKRAKTPRSTIGARYHTHFAKTNPSANLSHIRAPACSELVEAARPELVEAAQIEPRIYRQRVAAFTLAVR
jgi:hypothetical protein